MSNSSQNREELEIRHLLKECADPLSQERIDRASWKFLKRIEKPSPSSSEPPPEGGKPTLWKALTVAASVAICGVTMWAILFVPKGVEHRDNAPDPGQSAQEGSFDEKKFWKLIEELGGDDPDDRELASEELRSLSDKFPKQVQPLLEKAARSPDPEVRARVQTVLAKMMARRHSELISTKLLWIEKRGFAAFSDMSFLSRQMRRMFRVKPGRQDIATFLVARIEADRVVNSAVICIRIAVYANAPPRVEFEIARWGAYSESKAKYVSADTSEVSPRWPRNVNEDLDLTEVFRRWPALQEVSALLLSHQSGEDFRKELLRALVHKRPEFRAVATHGLRHFSSRVSVELALSMLDDDSPMVKAAARGTLDALVGKRKGTPDELRKWWARLHKELQKARLDTQFEKGGLKVWWRKPDK